MLLALGPVRAAASIAVVAAENFYGGVAQQIGTPHVAVTSILSNPDQDPHLFEVSPLTARALYAARIVVYNGIDYDPWMAKLSGATASHDRQIIVAADLVGRKTGDNPHIWYDPKTMPAVAGALAEALSAADPVHMSDYQQRLAVPEATGRPMYHPATLLKIYLYVI